MSTLWIISWVVWLPALLLSMSEMIGRPRRIQCDCRTGWQAYQHLRPVWLLVIGVLYVLSDVFGVAAGKKVPIIAAVGAYYIWRWWRHTKNSRKKLKDKVLGVVRQTTAGLKVVPVGGEVR